ncbi:MAG: DUF2970 domain-containing protein [Gammaproteobacteria bacterium]
MNETPSPTPPQPEQPRSLPLSSIVRSVFAAAFGVQSQRNRERDFGQGSYRHFVIAGILFTVLFILTLVTVVRIVLS